MEQPAVSPVKSRAAPLPKKAVKKRRLLRLQPSAIGLQIDVRLPLFGRDCRAQPVNVRKGLQRILHAPGILRPHAVPAVLPVEHGAFIQVHGLSLIHIWWRNLPSVYQNLYTRSRLTEEEHLNWLNSHVFCGLCEQFIIYDRETGLPVGSVFIKNINREA